MRTRKKKEAPPEVLKNQVPGPTPTAEQIRGIPVPQPTEAKPTTELQPTPRLAYVGESVLFVPRYCFLEPLAAIVTRIHVDANGHPTGAVDLVQFDTEDGPSRARRDVLYSADFAPDRYSPNPRSTQRFEFPFALLKGLITAGIEDALDARAADTTGPESILCTAENQKSSTGE
jgi:hypothetical protein